MRVFVTGATGFVGLAVADAYARAGHQVLGLARSSDKARLLAAREIEPVSGTLQESATWRARAAQCQVLVHCAMDYAAETYALDRAAIEALASERGHAGHKRTLIYTSGVWVYGDTRGERVDEGSALNPAKLVAQRVQSEELVLSRAGPQLASIVIRAGCVYGGRGSLTAAWFESAQRRGAARIVGDGSQRWAMVHVDDLAQLYLLAGESGLGCEVLNATENVRPSVRECAEAASRVAGAGGKIETIPQTEAAERLGPLAEALGFSQHVDSSKAARLLGWRPRHAGFVDEVDRLYLSWRAHRDG
jgi:nucleoside-diphosphate-sugar epimerase